MYNRPPEQNEKKRLRAQQILLYNNTRVHQCINTTLYPSFISHTFKARPI